MTAAAARLVRPLGSLLPHGRSLPDDVWRRRHRALLALLAAHPFVIAPLALRQGFDAADAFAEAGVVAAIALLAVVATRTGWSRKLASGIVSLGLITCSAVVVHISGGVVEAHFHFFVMLSALVLYEDWIPFLLALAYVVVHHGVAGTVDPTSVYNHHGAWNDPWKWAGIHAGFVAAASVANIAAWRLNEDVRAETRAAYREARKNADESRRAQLRLTKAEELARIGSWEWDVAADEIVWSDELYRIWGMRPDEIEPSYEAFLATVHPGDRERVDATVRASLETLSPYESEFRLVRPDGGECHVHAQGEVVADATGAPIRMVGAAQDITERKESELERERLLAQERESNERLRELDRLKDDFVASVSHELRTPLTSIRGYLELVLEGDAGDLTDDQARFLATVDRNAERLLRVVGDLLFVAQVDAGTLTLERGDVDLEAVARQSVEAAQPAANEKGIAVSLAADPVPTVSGDRARLSQLVDNLVSNAIKFTPAGGSVEVRLARDNGRVRLDVSDTGMGIPHDEQARLFERFFRSTEATERAIQGTGLGLSIAKAIAEAHGGSITFESTEGEGTVFHVALPPQPRRPARTVRNKLEVG